MNHPRLALAATGGVLFSALAGCGPPGWPDHNGSSVQTGPPAITEFELVCDLEGEAWALTVAADAWSGGGQLFLTVDAAYVEAHGVDSVSVAADGSADELELELNMVGDWREVDEGATTVFSCAAGAAALFVLYDLDDEPSDCRAAGPDPSWADVDGALPCDDRADISLE